MKRDTDEFDLEEMDLEELDLEEDDDSEEQWSDEFEDWSDEQKPLKPTTMILIFLGLVVLAAIICAILWDFTHRNRDDSGNLGASAEIFQNIGDDWYADPTDDVNTELTPEDSDEDKQSQTLEMASQNSADDMPESGSEEAAFPPKEGTDSVQESATESSSENKSESATASQTESVDANRVSTKDGRVIVFTDCDDIVSPKEYVNLRLEPSTSEGNATVHCRLNYGETVHRTGISEDSGWSRVEKDGVVCYVVSSFIYVVEETP